MILVKVYCVDKVIDLKSEDANIKFPSFDIVKKDLNNGSHRLIVDMDAHLDAIDLDFTNSYVK